MEMDGIASKISHTETKEGMSKQPSVMVVATTERKEMIDPALLRPGRLSIHIHLPLPDPSARLVLDPLALA